MTNHDQIDIAIAAMRLYAETHPRPPHVTQSQAAEILDVLPAPTFTERDMETAIAVPITERLRAIKIGSFSIDEGSHSKHFAVAPLCREAAAEIERSNERERQLYGECLLLADVLRDAFEVVKTIEGEEQDECDKLTGLCLSMAHALALYDERRIEPPNV